MTSKYKTALKEFIRTLYHRPWVQQTLSGLLVGGLPGIGYHMVHKAPYDVEVVHTSVALKNLPKMFESFKIIQISDLHYGPTNNKSDYFRKCVDLINSHQADLVVLTGDFLQWDPKYLKGLVHLLKPLTATHGVLASLGNHDYGVCHAGLPASDPIDHLEVIDEFTKGGIQVLHNEKKVITKESHELHIVGLGDYWTPHYKPEIVLDKILDKNLDKNLENQKSNKATVLLSHNPDTFEHLSEYHFDLMLSGHVHGGQISFPIVGPLAVPVKNRHWRRGLHQQNDKHLYVTRGLGFTFKARLLARPEISLITLTKKNENV